MVRVICLFISICLLLPMVPGRVVAIDIESLGITIPNITNLSPSEQSAPKSAGDMVMESPVNIDNYKLGPGDTLAIHIIVGNADLSIDHNLFVGADGNVFFPNIGTIYLSGLSLRQAEQKIDGKIKNMYREPYKLFVLLSQPKTVKIYMSGMVKKPGPLAVYDNSRISEVISLSGGVVSGASNRYVYIRRKGLDGKEKMMMADLFEAYRSRDLTKDIRIEAGDVIEVPDANNVRISQNSPADENLDKLLFEGKETYVYVYGEVARSGRFEFVPGKRISDYISYAGGATGRALLGGVTLTRHVNGKPQQYKIDVSDILYNGNSNNDIEVLSGDVIKVPGNFFYFTDFASFANTVILALTLYNMASR